MKCFAVLLLTVFAAFGYGFWDSAENGGRTESFSPYSAGLAGTTAPQSNSAFSIFSNPSALAGSDKVLLACTGWSTGWREEITYHYTCTEPFRNNLGSMTPRGSFSLSVPISMRFTAGAGIATVSQFQMKATVYDYVEVAYNHRELWRTLVTDATGDLSEALLSIAGSIGPVKLGISPGLRFGSGEATTYANRVTGPDSTLTDSWDCSEFACRGGASLNAGYVSLYSSFVTGGTRYDSSVNLGATAYFPWVEGGFLGTELSLLDGDNLKMAAFARFPSVIENCFLSAGISGYRPDQALKTGLGLSVGGDYTFGGYRVSAAFQYQGRYRDGTAVPQSYVNHLYDSGETIIIGFEKSF